MFGSAVRHHTSTRSGAATHPSTHLVPPNQRVDDLERAARVEDVRVHPVTHAQLDAAQDLGADDRDGEAGRIDERGGAPAVEPDHAAAVL